MKFPGLDIEIAEVQKRQLEILLVFDSFCKKHDLKYILFGGTLLGAVRHKGFIPWDDDIDVAMPRQDYERFLKLRNEFDAGYFIQNYFTDRSIFKFTKIRKNNTIMKSKSNDSTTHQGIWIDIFPLDVSNRSTLCRYLHLTHSRILFVITTSSLKSKVLSSKKGFNRIVRTLFYYLNKLVGRKYWFKRYRKNNQKYKHSKNDGYYYHLSNGTSYQRQYLFRIPIKSIDDPIEIEFEGYTFFAPRNPDKYLSQLYGDYEVLPPEKERYPHHNISYISFDE